VFVSSTLKELERERLAAREAIESLRLVPVMFELGARPHPAAAVYRSYLDQSHVFVGIYGESYGWVGPGMTISGLEDEFVLAEGMPQLVYLKEPAPNRDAHLEALIDRIKDSGGLSFRSFTSPEELRRLLADDLAVLLSERFAQQGFESTPTPEIRSTAYSTLIGRETELEQIERLLKDPAVRLITLYGTGGVGKTRLALEAAQRFAGEFPDGSIAVWLDAINDPRLAIEAIAAELGVRNRSDQSLLSLVGDRIAGKRMLLLLDNFEHVMAAATQLADLMEVPTASKFIITSRELLQIRGEHAVALDPLPLPRHGESALEAVKEVDAVALFAERARAASGSFSLTEENAGSVAEIVRRLDGLPLAIEVAAARTRILSPAALLERLESALDIPAARIRDLPERQRTIRATIAWSYDLLDDCEKKALERFSVFAGDVSLEAAEAVLAEATDPMSVEVLDVLSSLIDKSLIRRVEQDGLRFRALASIRRYAEEKLGERGATASASDAHVAFYTDLAATTSVTIHSPEQVAALARLEREHDNFQAALEWAFSCENANAGLVLCNHLRWFWYLRGHLSVGMYWTRRFLSLPSGSIQNRAGGAATGGMMAFELGELADAQRFYDDAISLLDPAEDEEELAWARTGMGAVKHALGDVASAEQLQNEAHTYFRDSGHLLGQCATNTRLGAIALGRCDYEAAVSRFNASLAVRRQIRDPWGTSFVLTELGELALVRNDPVTAEDHLREALDLLEQVGYVDGIARVRDLLGSLAAGAGDWQLALDEFISANRLFGEFGNRYGAALTLAHEASAEIELGRDRIAARHAFEAFGLADEVAHPRAVAAALEAIAAALAQSGHEAEAMEMISAADSVKTRGVISSPSSDPFRRMVVSRLPSNGDEAPGVDASEDAIRAAVDRVASQVMAPH
jgi:predicted ATPase